MKRHLLIAVAVLGWGAVGFVAYQVVVHLAWFGVMLIGLLIIVAALWPEIDEDAPAATADLMRRQYQQSLEGNAESRLARFASRLERNKWLYIIRTIGIALALLGLNMFVTHQI